MDNKEIETLLKQLINTTQEMYMKIAELEKKIDALEENIQDLISDAVADMLDDFEEELKEK